MAAERAAAGTRLRFGVVHRYSSHNYMLRYWLAAVGIRPDRDVEIVVTSPPFAADALAAGEVDGICVGEPWNSIAVDRGVGRIAMVTAQIWRRGVEKVLALRADTVAERGDEVAGGYPIHRYPVADLVGRCVDMRARMLGERHPPGRETLIARPDPRRRDRDDRGAARPQREVMGENMSEVDDATTPRGRAGLARRCRGHPDHTRRDAPGHPQRGAPRETTGLLVRMPHHIVVAHVGSPPRPTSGRLHPQDAVRTTVVRRQQQ